MTRPAQCIFRPASDAGRSPVMIMRQKNKFRISDPKFILKNSYSKNKRTVFSYCTEDYHPAGNPLRYKLFYARSTLPERMHLVQT